MSKKDIHQIGFIYLKRFIDRVDQEAATHFLSKNSPNPRQNKKTIGSYTQYIRDLKIGNLHFFVGKVGLNSIVCLYEKIAFLQFFSNKIVSP